MKKEKNGLCKNCNGLCCRYFALPIDTPKTRKDFDDIRWFLCHEKISVFVEEGDWYINIDNKCRYLDDSSHHCAIYEKRPRICRGYKTHSCDLTDGGYDYELHFKNDKQLEEYIKEKFSKKKLKKRKKKK
ncbi:MAG: YkgJ family cysteine cluster protein [Phycisphaerae bacterium]